MSSDGLPMSDKIDTRFSTPAPELDDHRPRRPGVSPTLARNMEQRPAVPALEIHEPTPQGSAMGPGDLLHVDHALRLLPEGSPAMHSMVRDFENAVSDGSDDGSLVGPPAMRRGSARRDTRRGGRPRELKIVDRSRDTSSSRSTSPANSVEAFAEPRRRQRANTVGSLPESIDLQRYRAAGAGSHTDTRRPTLSNVSIPPGLQSRAGTFEDDVRNDAAFIVDDEPGKTYRIDFEELEEFVALCKQGKIPVGCLSSSGTSDNSSDAKVFHDQRRGAIQQDVQQNACINGETFFEKTPATAAMKENSDEKKQANAAKYNSIDRFTFFSTDVQKPKYAKTLIDYVADGSKFSEMFDVGPEGGVWWLDVVNPTQAELDVLASAFQIHRLTKEDIETQEPREKVELFRDYYFVCFRSFNMNKLSEDFLEPVHVYIIVTGDGVLSFSYTPNPHARNVRRRISKVGDFVSLGPDYICYALIDDIVDCFAPIIREAEHESENIEDAVFIARDDDFAALLRQIGEARKRVLNVMRLLGGKADVIKGFAKRCNEQFDITPRGDIGLYLGDIQDHVVTMMSNLGHVEKMLSRSHANYLAQLSVDHLLKGNSTNKALAKITVIATILVPLNLITGLFGMNVPVPGRETTGLQWFGGIVGVIFAFVTFSLVVAKRMRLI